MAARFDEWRRNKRFVVVDAPPPNELAAAFAQWRRHKRFVVSDAPRCAGR